MKLVCLADVDPYPSGVEPYPPSGSYGCQLGLQVFDLITPDGQRVWVASGWSGQTPSSVQIHAWTIQDFVAGDRRPSKKIHDDPKCYAALRFVNKDADQREQFIADYMAVNHQAGQQEYLLGLQAPQDWVGLRVYPYQGLEHIILDEDPLLRLLTLDARGGGKPLAVDKWEVTASWHFPFNELIRRPQGAGRSRPVGVGRPHSRPAGQFLYRLYSRSGELLYVGVTDNCLRRWKEHSKIQPWWSEVHRLTQDWFPDRTSVEAAERRAIQVERPVHNKTHNRGEL